MQADRSLEILAHFDSARGVVPRPNRGVGWVLAWFGAVFVLCITATSLAQFGYCLTAERALSAAAHAGALEATMPRATRQSVGSAIERRLQQFAPTCVDHLRFSVVQNDRPVAGVIRPAEYDRFTVSAQIPSDEALPEWLRTIRVWPMPSELSARAQRKVPGRYLERP